MARRPQDRYQSAAELLVALAAASRATEPLQPAGPVLADSFPTAPLPVEAAAEPPESVETAELVVAPGAGPDPGASPDWIYTADTVTIPAAMSAATPEVSTEVQALTPEAAAPVPAPPVPQEASLAP